MQFSSVLVAVASLAVAQAAQFTNTASQFVGVKTGTPFDLTWSNATGPVTILLKNGPSNALQTVLTIATGLTTTSFSWTPPSSVVSGTYAFEIDDNSGPNYSVQFTIAGGVSSSSSSSSASTSSQSSSSSSSASTSSSSSVSLTSSSSSSTATTASNSTSTANRSSSKTSSPSKTSSSSTSPASSTSSPTGSISSASNIASPLGFVILAIAAFMTLN